jgi:hypothetical protein
MATEKSTKPTIPPVKTLNGISARLFDRADSIEQITLQDLVLDLRLAAMGYDRLAHVRVEISQIAAQSTDAHTARELRDLLDDDATEQIEAEMKAIAVEKAAAEKADNPGHKPPLDFETLTMLSARLLTHADDIAPSDRQDIVADIRIAARVASKLASLRFCVSEIAEQALTRTEWDRAAFARDLRAALADAAEGE